MTFKFKVVYKGISVLQILQIFHYSPFESGLLTEILLADLLSTFRGEIRHFLHIQMAYHWSKAFNSQLKYKHSQQMFWALAKP